MESLTASWHNANSRFFTDCYLEAAAIVPRRSRKLVNAHRGAKAALPKIRRQRPQRGFQNSCVKAVV